MLTRHSGGWKIFAILAASACVDHDFSPPPDLSSYHPGYMAMAGRGLILMPVRSDNHVLLEYDGNGRLTKRTGGVLPMPGTTGFSGQFSQLVYEDVTYAGDRVIVEEKYADPDWGFYGYRKEMFLDDDRIIRTIKRHWVNGRMYLDTTEFAYEDRTLRKTTSKSWTKNTATHFSYGSTTERIFTFSSGNLAKVESVTTSFIGSQKTVTEIFEGYDHASNPTKKLIIFDDAFYRALSRNNFTRYSYEEISLAGTTSEGFITWEFIYDEEGHPTYRYSPPE